MSVDTKIQSLIPQMAEAMHRYAGIGLAAPQIGRSQQIFLIENSANPRRAIRQGTRNTQAFLNPVIEWRSKTKEVDEEGCLSLPGLFLPIKRPDAVRVRCLTGDGKPVILEAKGLAARVFQHEIDHLQGKLIIDRIGPVQRLKIRKQLKEIKETGEVQSA